MNRMFNVALENTSMHTRVDLYADVRCDYEIAQLGVQAILAMEAVVSAGP